MKTIRKKINAARFVEDPVNGEAMFGARICIFFTRVRQSYFLDPFSLQSKQLNPDYVIVTVIFHKIVTCSFIYDFFLLSSISISFVTLLPCLFHIDFLHGSEIQTSCSLKNIFHRNSFPPGFLYAENLYRELQNLH